MTSTCPASDALERSTPPFYVVGGAAVAGALFESRTDLFEVVADAYRLHENGRSVVPDSSFLRCPDKPNARIIALPAYMGDPVNRAGIKWISSFPHNRGHNLARASAVLILNDPRTGYPIACMEGALISSHRTAASAVLAAEALSPWSHEAVLAVVGTGVIARTTVEWLLARAWRFPEIRLYDTDRKEMERFAAWLEPLTGVAPVIADELATATKSAGLVLFATTASAPHVHDLNVFSAAPTILNLSLRDLGVEIILAAQNLVDDVDHCCKAQTSIHLAEQRTGSRGFIAGTLGALLEGRIAPDRSRVRIFSPFGLGVLDVAVGDFLLRRAMAAGTAQEISGFFAHASRW